MAWLWGLSMLCSTATALAQQPDSTEQRQRMQEAEQALRAGNYRAAQALYRSAHESDPGAPTLLGLANSAIGLGQYVQAALYLEDALSNATQALSGAVRERAERDLQRALARVGRFRVNVEPVTAAVLVDDVPAALTQRGELLLAPGAHVVEVHASHHAPQRIELTARAGEQREFGVTLQRERDLAPGLDREEVVVFKPPPPDLGPKRIWTWVMLGSAGLFTGTAVLFHQLARADADEIATACPGGPNPPCSLEQIDRRINGSSIRTYDVLTNVSIGLAIASGVTSVVLFFVEDRHADKAQQAQMFRLHPTGIVGRF